MLPTFIHNGPNSDIEDEIMRYFNKLYFPSNTIKPGKMVIIPENNILAQVHVARITELGKYISSFRCYYKIKISNLTTARILFSPYFYLIIENGIESCNYQDCHPTVLVYTCNEDGPSSEVASGNNDENSSSEALSNYTQWNLPAKEFDGLWESLIYDHHIKNDLLSYAYSALLFSDLQGL
jgi:hypothetical protein